MSFYTDLLRFVVAKADIADPQVASMMRRLSSVAEQLDRDGGFTVPPEHFAETARALAGVAGFFQQRILPEAVAHGHDAVAGQIRKAVDDSMAYVQVLLTAEAEGVGEAVRLG